MAGYQSGRGGVDSYGVDHSGFTTRDELEYQSARLARENQLAEGFAKQGIAEENYPQYGTNFWGGSPENNYGFGTSNIKQNIENITNRLNNGANSGQVFANSDHSVNTESLVGQPSSYFQNNSSAFVNNNTSGLGNNNTSGLNSTATGGFNNDSTKLNQNNLSENGTSEVDTLQQSQQLSQIPEWQKPAYSSTHMYAWQRNKQPPILWQTNQQDMLSPGRAIDYKKLAEGILNNQSVQPDMIQHDNQKGYNIRNDNNYEWTNSEPYDRGGDIISVYNNFRKINTENPIISPTSSGNKVTDFVVIQRIKKLYPHLAKMIRAYDLGYRGAGYYDNLKRAYRESHRYDRVFSDEELLSLQNR